MKRALCTIETEIKDLKAKAAQNIIAIGEKLIEARALVPRGKWLEWLVNNVDMSERSARNFMRVAVLFPVQERQAIAGIDVTKLYQLARVPEKERPYFLKAIDVHAVSTRELEYWVRLWIDQDFYRGELRKITENLCEKGDVLLLSKWGMMLSEYSRELSVFVEGKA